MENRLAEEIGEMLAEVMGAFIASATFKKNCDLIGTTPEDLTADQLPALAEKIERSVTFFNDAATAKQVAEKIRTMK